MISRSKPDMDRTAKLGISLIVVLLLTLPALALIISFQKDDGGDVQYQTDEGSPTGDMSMDADSRSVWEDYLRSTPGLEFSSLDISGIVTSESPDITYQIPDLNETDVYFREGSEKDSQKTQDEEGSYSEDRTENDAAPGTDSGREVEESDIVKVIDNRMYVLNQYRGLVVVNIGDPTSPYIEGAAKILGHPVSMYVVDFLGFVIVSNAPSRSGEGDYSGMLYIVDLLDNSNPRIVKMVEIPGYPVDSRRVGEVIYVVSNENDYNYRPWFRGEMVDMDGTSIIDEGIEAEEIEKNQGPVTFITSIGFYDPLSIGQRDMVEINGNAGMIHASSFAIYVPQPNHDYSKPLTRFIYVDISDPEGDIVVRDDIDVPGLLMDRYQMDYYRGMFRVVTQKWPSLDWWSDLPMSTLYVIDARDPDDLKIISSLLVDDSGNLMATRFAGERAYTIHLPRTIDPLDVIDLSDPSNPRLTDILELPGWVEHMEVIGYNIIAVGVDDSSDDGWKVSLSLFDVRDSSNAILKDRIIIGEGHTYSSANYDPKALTILENRGIVLIPFNSHDWNRYEGQKNGVQIISFDLVEGSLEKGGVIPADDNVQRTRWVNNAVVTMSQRMIMTVDVSDISSPDILSRVEIASNVVDAFFRGDHLVTMLEPYWGQNGGGIRVSHGARPDFILGEHRIEGLEFINMERKDHMVYIKGIRQEEGESPVSEVYIYDMNDPTDPHITGPVTIDIPPYLYGGPYYGKDYEEVPRNEDGSSSELYNYRLYYDPMNMKILGDGSLAVYSWNWNRYHTRSIYSMDLRLISLQGTDAPAVKEYQIPVSDHVNNIQGNDERIILVTNNWYPPSTVIYDVDLTGVEANISGVHRLTGNFIGALDDLSRFYTKVEFSSDNSTRHGIIAYGMEQNRMVILQSINVGSPLTDVRFAKESIVVLSSGWDVWWRYPYPEIDVAYDERADAGSDPDSRDSPYPSVPYQGTEIIRIDLENGLFGNLSRLQLEKNVYASLVTEEFIVLDWSMTHTVVSIEDGIESLGTWFGNGWISGGDIDDDRIVLAKGMYGIEIMII